MEARLEGCWWWEGRGFLQWHPHPNRLNLNGGLFSIPPLHERERIGFCRRRSSGEGKTGEGEQNSVTHSFKTRRRRHVYSYNHYYLSFSILFPLPHFGEHGDDFFPLFYPQIHARAVILALKSPRPTLEVC